MSSMPFSKEDMQYITARGQTSDTVLSQIEVFKKGMPGAKLHRPCTVGDGITVLQSSDIEAFSALYMQAVSAGRVTKFVPASGAATRMFQTLTAVYEQQESGHSQNSQDVRQFTNYIKHFAFYDDLQIIIGHHGDDLETLLSHGQYTELLAYLLTSKGLNYANLPKALLKFHRYC